MSTLVQSEVAVQKDFLPLNGTDHVEFYVGNARQSAYFYRLAFGLKLVAYAGPETGVRDRASYVLEQGKVRFVLTTPLRPDGEIAEHVRIHGDGVRDVALWVDDARQAWKETTKRGARSVREPFELKDEHGMVRISSIAAYGDTIHSFVERSEYKGPFLPGYRAMPQDPLARPVGLIHIDHMVGNVGWNEMNRWVDFYAQIMGFSLYQHFDDKDISDGIFGADVESDGQRQRASEVPHQRTGRGTRGSRRSKSIWSSTTARACSISRMATNDIWRRWRSCRSRVWRS